MSDSQNGPFYRSDLDPDPMILIPKLDLEMSRCTTIPTRKLLGQVVQKLQPVQTERQTGKQYVNITFSNMQAVNILNLFTDNLTRPAILCNISLNKKIYASLILVAKYEASMTLVNEQFTGDLNIANSLRSIQLAKDTCQMVITFKYLLYFIT